MKIIAKYLGGSFSYGLNNQDSDEDIRGLFLNDSVGAIIGLERHDHQNSINEDLDIQLFELRHFLNLLRRGNTQCLEMLFNNVWLEKSAEFDIIQNQKYKLLDSNTIYKCFRGYSHSERNLIFGRAHLGRIGEKRKSAIEAHGYSFRNASHCMRLIRAAILFFRDNYFPVNIVEDDKEYGNLIKDIKFNPQNYKPEDLEKQLIELEKEMDAAFEGRKVDYKYDLGVANKICYDLYLPLLEVI